MRCRIIFFVSFGNFYGEQASRNALICKSYAVTRAVDTLAVEGCRYSVYRICKRIRKIAFVGVAERKLEIVCVVRALRRVKQVVYFGNGNTAHAGVLTRRNLVRSVVFVGVSRAQSRRAYGRGYAHGLFGFHRVCRVCNPKFIIASLRVCRQVQNNRTATNVHGIFR